MTLGLTPVRLELSAPVRSLPALSAALYAVVARAKRTQVGWIVIITTADVIALLSGAEATDTVLYPSALVAITTEDGLAELPPIIREATAT